MSTMPAIDIGVLDHALTHVTVYARLHFCQTRSALLAKWISGFRQGFAAMGTELSLCGHVLLQKRRNARNRNDRAILLQS